ncbi:uncharacterized protein [Chelonus insularis]|uniref:uncharacterized protein isoform X2 n=1 Tax=Chelonus insularis TaxID=460826 RepID=UPI00158DE5C8|nr:uncharacterized protein LOC118065279 isoform X2 [Chelonus insularis]
MSGGGFRGRGFGPHGPRFNSPISGGRNDGSRNGPRHRGNYSRGNYSNPPQSFSSQSGQSRRGDQQQENWPQNRSLSRWEQPHGLQGNNQPPTWSHNRGEPFQNSSVRFQYHNNASYHSRSGRGHFRSNSGGGGNFRFTEHRGSNNYYNPPYYNTPYKENTFHQQEQNIIPNEPVPPLLGSEEERQQKITEAADELKRKLLTNRAIPEEESNWYEDFNIDSMTAADKEANTIKAIPELKHGPPELKLTLNDLKDIGRVDIDNTIDPSATEPNLIIEPYDESAETNSIQHDSNDNNEETQQLPLITLEYSSESIDLDIDDGTKKSIKKSKRNSKVRLKNAEKTVTEHQITGDAIFNSSKEIIQASSVIETEDKNKKYVNVEDISLNAIDDESVININQSNMMRSTSIDSLSNSQSSTVQNSLDSFSIMTAESVECISKSSLQKSNPKNILSPNTLKTNESLSETSEHDKSEKQIHQNCQKQETKNTKSEKIHIISAYNKRKMKKESSKPPLDFDPRKPPPHVNQSFTTNEEILQPPPAFDPRRNLSTIIPDFDPQMPPPILNNQTDTIKSFNTHLPPMPSIIPSAPATGVPINMPSTMPGYGHPGYNPMVPYVPAVPMPYSQVIAPVEYSLTQMSQPPLPPSTVNDSLSVERVTNKSETNGDPNLSVDDVLGEMKEAMEFAKQCMVMGEDEDVINFPTLPNLPPLPKFGEHNKDKPTTKPKKTKKSKQETCYGPHPKPDSENIQETSREQTLASIRLPEENSTLSLEKKSKTSEINYKITDEKNTLVEETNKSIEEKVKCYLEESPADDLGRRKVMFNLSSKFKKLNKTEEWMNEAMEEENKQKNRKLKILSSPAVAVVAPTTMTSTLIVETKQNNHTSQEKISSKLIKDSSSSENSHQKDKDSIQTKNKNKEKESEKRESKKYSDKIDTYEDIQRKTRKSSRAQLTSGSKSEKNDTNNEFIAEKISEAKTYTHKLSAKKITPALTESSWKNRVITRFLKMSKNDIQNMINNSSLRKFDIAMQHLVKEKKSSLSLEMRLNEHEKMKNSSNYNNEDFMSQLQAILDPAATVDITNLPTTFLHQLSEVLHLDPLPTDLEDSSDKSEPQISLNQDLLSLKMDKPVSIDSSQYPETNTPASSTHEMSKPRKIDKQSIDMTKYTSTMDTSTHFRTRNKRNEVDTSVQRSATSSTVTPIQSASTIDNLNMDDLDDIFVAGIRAKAKSTLQSLINSPITTNERISTTMPVKKIELTYTESDKIPTAELDEIFSPVLAKTKTFSLKTTASTNMETLEREQSHMSHRESHSNSSVISSWKRKGIDDPDNFRNLTKEEYEARYGDFSHISNEDENRTITHKTQKMILNGREIITYSTQSNKNYTSYTPPDGQNNNLTESENESVSGLESDSSSSSSSVSDEESLDVSKVLRFIKEREKIAKKKSINEEIRDEVSAEIEKKRREKNAKHRSHKSRSKKKERRKKEKDRKGRKKKPKKKRKRRHHSPLSNISENENAERPLWLLRENEIKKEPTEEILKEEEDENESDNHIIHSKTTLITQTSMTTSESIKNIGPKVGTTIQTSTVVSPQQSSIVNPIVTNSVISNIKISPASPSPTFSSRTNKTSCPSNLRSSQSPVPHTKTKAQLKQMPEVLTKTKTDQPTSIETQLFTEKESINNQICVQKTNLTTEQSSKIIPITTEKITTSTASGPRKLDIKQYQERAHRRKLQEQEKGRAIAENPTVLTQDLLKLPTINKCPTASENQLSLITSSEPSKSTTNLPINTTSTPEAEEIEKIVQKIPRNTTSICKTEEKSLTETSKISNIPVCTKLTQTSTSTSMLKTSKDKNIEESKFANIKSEGSKEMKLKEKLKRKPVKPVITNIAVLKNNPLSSQNKKSKIGPKSSMSVKTLNMGEKKIKTSESFHTTAQSVLLSSASSNTNILNEKKASINIEIDQQNKLKQKMSKLEEGKDISIKELSVSQVNLAEELCEVPKEIVLKDKSTLCKKIHTHGKMAQKFFHYFTSSKQIQSDGFPDTVTFEIMETNKQYIPIKNFNDESTLSSNKTNENLEKTIHENTTDLNELSNPVLNKEMKEEIDESSICSEVQPISINLQFEKDNGNGDMLLLVSNRKKNSIDAENITEETSIEKPFKSDDCSVKEVALINMPMNKLETIEIQSVIKEKENEIKKEELLLSEKEENLSISHLQELEKLSSTLSNNSEDRLSEDISECSTLVPSEEIKIINTLERITTEEFVNISDGELIDDKVFSENPLPEINSLSESPGEAKKDLTLRESELLSKTSENSEILSSETNDWNVSGTKNEDEIDLIPEEIIDQSPHEQELESSLLRVQTLNTYESEDIETPFSSKSVVLHDKVLAADNVRNSFLDDPITFSNTKSPTSETMEFEILNDADIVGSIYNNQLDETSPIDSIEDVPADEPFGEDEGVNTLTLPALESPCLPPETDDSFILSQNSSKQIKDTDFPDKELMKEIEGTSPERLPSPILQLSSKLSDNDDDDDDNNNNNADNDISNDKNHDDDNSRENVATIISTTRFTEGVINTENNYPESTGPTEHHIEPTSDVLKNNSLTVDISIDKDIELNSFNEKSNKKFPERDKIEESLEEILSGKPSKYAQMSPTIEENILNIVDHVQTEEISTSSIQSHTSKKQEKYSSKDDSSRKSRSKSRTPPRDLKKNKKRHHHRKKSKLSAEKVEEAITANITKPILVTKDSVMMRMQEIDLAIQKLMDEKMALYQMLKDDKWPSVQTEEHPILTEPKTPKVKSHLSTSLTDKLAVKTPRVVVSRLAESDMKQASTSSVVELLQSKPEYSSTPKHESLLLNKFSKTEEKNNKILSLNNTAISKMPKKRKHKEDRGHNKNKNLKTDGSPEAKRQMNSQEYLHKHKKSSIAAKNIRESSRKPFKLSQLLTTFKPKTSIEKRRSTSPKELQRIQKSSSISIEKNVNVSQDLTKLLKKNDLNSSEEANKESGCNGKNKLSVDNDKNNENEHFELSKKQSQENFNISEDVPNLIYSDDSTWDHIDSFHEKSERSTGLLLLEESMKREKAAKKSKYLTSKKKISNSNTKEDLVSSDLDDTMPLIYVISKKKLKKKQSMLNKKLNKSSNNEETPRIDHTEEIIDAVATNRVHDLYDNSISKDNEQCRFEKESNNQLLTTIEKLDDSNMEETRETSNKIETRTEVVESQIIEGSTETDNSKKNYLDTEIREKEDFHPKTPDFVEPLQITEQNTEEHCENENNPNEEEWTTLDSVGFIDEKDDGLDDISDDRLEIHTSFEEENSNISSTDILEKGQEESATLVRSSSPIEEDNINNTQSDAKMNNYEKNQKISEIQSTILQDWAESPSHSSRYDNDINLEMKKSRFDLNQITTRESPLMVNANEETKIFNVEENNKESEIDDTSVNDSQRLLELKESTTTKNKKKSDDKVEEENKEEENTINQDEEENLKKRKSSLEREIERPTSIVKELEKYGHSFCEPVRSKSAVQELEKSEYSIKETNNKRPKSATKEIERPKSIIKTSEKFICIIEETKSLKSAVKEIETPSSTVNENDRSKFIVKDLEVPKNVPKDVELEKSTIRDSEKIKLTRKEIKKITEEKEASIEENVENEEILKKKREKIKTKSKVMDDEESSVEKDIDNDEVSKKKREKSNKNKNLLASRRSSRSSRQSDDSNRTSRSRSRSTRVEKSPSSRDTSPPEMDLKSRPTSGSSSSSSVNSRKKSTTNSRSRETTKIDSRSTRRKRKQKRLGDSDINLMRKCKVRLIDCKQIYREPSLYSSFLKSHGLSRINNWMLQEIIPRQETPPRESKRPSISDEDKNHSDDDSMELIQVEEVDDLQTMDTLDSLADDSIQDSRDQNDNNSSISSEFAESPQNVDIAESDFDEYRDNDEEPEILESDIEILEKQSPATNASNLIYSKDIESEEPRRTQYTVHKGPILDIKVFGDSFLAASEDGAIYRYSQRSNGILNIYKGHDAAVTCLYIHEVPGTAESGNTRWNLFSGSLDATLRCYDVINGSLDRHISEIGSPIQCMDQAWGNIFIGTKSGHISRYDIKSGCLREDKLDFSDKPILALRASTEGPRKILIVASRNQPITIRDAQNGLFLRTISGQRNHTVYSLLMDKNLVYCGTSNTSIPVFDFISGEQVAQYTAGVGIVCMRLYKQLLFAGCYDGNIYVFDTNDLKLICSIPGPGNMLLSLEIVNDEIIAGSKDRRLHAWRMPNQIRNMITDRT